MWHSPSLTSPITYLLAAPAPLASGSTSPRTFAVAYTDGSIHLWSSDPTTPEVEATEIVTFNGHKKSVTTMAFDHEGSRLASGGTEGEIVIWDRVVEVGLFRLKGHRGPVTTIHFIPHPTLPPTAHPGFIASTSRDTYLKLWDLSTQHCVQTVVAGRGEAWSCALKEEDTQAGEVEGDEEDVTGRWVILTGSGDGEGKVWKIEKRSLTGGVKENANGEVRLRDPPRVSLISLAPNYSRTCMQPPAAILDSTHLTSRLPPDPPTCSPPDVRPYYECLSLTIGRGNHGEAGAAEKAGERKGEEGRCRR